MWIPLVLGSFVFDESQLEVPESLSDVGGMQSIAEHKFPGGIITHQKYGFFPEPLKWKGKFSGQFAALDVEAVKRILAAGQEVPLYFGERYWLGRLAKFTPTIRNQNLYDYTAEFWPRVDLSSGVTPPIFTGFGSILALHLLSLQSMIASAQSGNILMGIVIPLIGSVLPDFVSLAAGSVAVAGGIISTIDVQTQQSIAIASLGVLAATAPLQASTDPTLSSPASDIASRVQAITGILASPPQSIATIHVVNPNLVVLATQYYQDPTLWQTIGNANGISDPMPVGTFNLTIPPAP